MRLWSIHPRYLDRQGLIALWREGLLAQKVLAGKTRGYRHHPQLLRFRESEDALASIGFYLHHAAEEAEKRGYRFERSKILEVRQEVPRIAVNRGQLNYEFRHLLKKLEVRQPLLFAKWVHRKSIGAHPLFRAVPGGIEAWERHVKSL